jgi:dihydrofolate synthase / folylpolyglutamate synthase
MATQSPQICPTSVPINTYEDALAFLERQDISRIKLGLSRMETLMASLGNPQETLPMVHIAGTNGKGSTAAMLTSILRAAGYQVGTFTSPHLVDVRERICWNGKPISKQDFQQEMACFVSHLEDHGFPEEDWPSYFECLNILAYCYFQRKQADITLFEVGLGGRLDSTNVVKGPSVSVITSIGWDHMERLGNTLAAIAQEKAGILKPNVPAILGPKIPDEALAAIQVCAATHGAPLRQASGKRCIPQGLSPEGTQQVFDQQTGSLLSLGLQGPYQSENLATVLEVVEELRQQGFQLSQTAVQQGLQQTQWPARFQYLPQEQLLIDGSHNIDGFCSLQEGLMAHFPTRPKVWVLSLRGNRDPKSLIELLTAFPETQSVLWVPGSPGFHYHEPIKMVERTRERVGGDVPIHTAESIHQALEWLQQYIQQDPSVLGIVTGSLYTAGEVLGLLQTNP